MKKNNNETLKETFVLAVQSYRKGKIENAENFCYKILNIDDKHFDSISMLATIFARKNNYKEAKKLLLKAITIQPDSASTLNNLGTACKELGEYEDAKQYYQKVLKIYPNYTNANYNLGLIFHKLRDLEKAKTYLQKTVEIQNNYALAYFSLANVYVDLKNFDSAISSYQKCIEINPNIPGAHNNLGLVFRILNDFENAIKCYNGVIKINPNHVGAHHNLALAYKELGDFKNAIKSHEAAIKHEPSNPVHYYYLSELKKSTLNLELKKKIKKITQDNKSNERTLAYSNFLLAKYERKEKNYEKELSHLVEGHTNFFESNAKKFKLGVKYCFDDVIKISEGAEVEGFDKNINYELKPIFIIGVPRSGSTLVEKIIGSGETLIPMGEETQVLENYFNKKLLEKKSLNLGSTDSIRNELHEIYKSKCLISKKYKYNFTDKSLNNFFYLELVKKIYPKAKIVNCKRNIISSIMSIFQNNLTELAWTHDLENIFKYFDNYFNIIENFDEVYPNTIYHVDYEKLVADPENESKSLMKFCNLSWDKKCLEFHKRKDLISKTASNVQIRQAIYQHSINRYLPYKKLLDKYGKKYSWFN